MPFVLTHAAHRVSLKNRRPSLILAKGCQIARPFDCCSFAFSFLLGATGESGESKADSRPGPFPLPPLLLRRPLQCRRRRGGGDRSPVYIRGGDRSPVYILV